MAKMNNCAGCHSFLVVLMMIILLMLFDCASFLFLCDNAKQPKCHIKSTRKNHGNPANQLIINLWDFDSLLPNRNYALNY